MLFESFISTFATRRSLDDCGPDGAVAAEWVLKDAADE
jgi:hypothetical protein